MVKVLNSIQTINLAFIDTYDETLLSSRDKISTNKTKIRNKYELDESMTSNTFEQRYKSVPKSSFDMNNIDKFKSSSKLIHILIARRSELIDEISFIIITEDFDNEN